MILSGRFCRQQRRGERRIAAREGPAQLRRVFKLLRPQDRAVLVRPQGDRDRRAGDARNHGAQEEGKGNLEGCRLTFFPGFYFNKLTLQRDPGFYEEGGDLKLLYPDGYFVTRWHLVFRSS